MRRDSKRLAAAIDRDPRPPQSVSKLQAARQLKAAGLWASFQAWLSAKPDQAEEWGLCHMIERNDEWTRAFAADANLTAADIDALFRGAAKR